MDAIRGTTAKLVLWPPCHTHHTHILHTPYTQRRANTHLTHKHIHCKYIHTHTDTHYTHIHIYTHTATHIQKYTVFIHIQTYPYTHAYKQAQTAQEKLSVRISREQYQETGRWLFPRPEPV